MACGRASTNHTLASWINQYDILATYHVPLP